jgi:hypothetical protein
MSIGIPICIISIFTCPILFDCFCRPRREYNTISRRIPSTVYDNSILEPIPDFIPYNKNIIIINPDDEIYLGVII